MGKSCTEDVEDKERENYKRRSFYHSLYSQYLEFDKDA